MDNTINVIELINVSKSYNGKNVLNSMNLAINKGEFIGIKGESGAGKSTLLNIIGLLEECKGKVVIEGKQIDYSDKKSIRKLLNSKIGYLFQNFALIDDLSVYENLKIVLKKCSKKEGKEIIIEELKKVGLEDTIDKKIFQLSGGEQQRIAVVRLILHKSEIILADEPTGSLDKRHTEIILNLLEEMKNKGNTVVMVSHDEWALSRCSRIINL